MGQHGRDEWTSNGSDGPSLPASVTFHQYDDGRWAWRCGQRTSVDQHCETFVCIEDAADHFMRTAEGKRAVEFERRQKLRVVST